MHYSHKIMHQEKFFFRLGTYIQKYLENLRRVCDSPHATFYIGRTTKCAHRTNEQEEKLAITLVISLVFKKRKGKAIRHQARYFVGDYAYVNIKMYCVWSYVQTT